VVLPRDSCRVVIASGEHLRSQIRPQGAFDSKTAASIRPQCIMKERPASEDRSWVWRRVRSVWLHSNRKMECSDCVVEGECWAVPDGGGFAPAPPGFSALVPVPMRGLYPELIKKGCRSIPPRSVEAAESTLGLLPTMALSSAQRSPLEANARPWVSRLVLSIPGEHQVFPLCQ
jgi:hypothetical protein